MSDLSTMKKRGTKSSETKQRTLEGLQRGSVVRIHRSSIEDDDVNPRRISEDNARRLRESIRKNGLVGHLVWNETTKHIVGGHQRLSALDSIMRSKDYELDVLKVNMPLKDEIRLNVVLNNQDSQGVFDFGMVYDLANDFKLDLSADFGFSDEVIEINFPEIADITPPSAGLLSNDPEPVMPDDAPRRASEEDIARMKALKHEARENLKKENAEFGDWKGEPKGIITLVFQCESDKREWLKSLNLDENKNVLAVGDMEAALIAELKENLLNNANLVH